MARRLIPSVSPRLADETAERVRRNHDQRITELQSLPLAHARIIKGVSLPDGLDVPIPHGLDRAVTVFVSPPKSPTATGRIVDNTPKGYDGNKYVVLRATGWGSTVTIDVLVF